MFNKLILSIAAASTLALSACSTFNGGQVTVDQHTLNTRIVQSCVGLYAAYSSVFEIAVQGKLNAAEKAQFNIVTQTVVPVCTQSTIPSDPNVAIQQITTAIATLGAIELAHGLNPNAPIPSVPAAAASSSK